MPNGFLGLSAVSCEQYMHFIANQSVRSDRSRISLRRDRESLHTWMSEAMDLKKGEELFRDPSDQ